MNTSKKGLTFIELIIVSALISILIAGIGVAMNLSLKSHDFLRKEVSKGDAIRSAAEYLAKHIKNSAYGIVTGGTTLNLYDPSGGLSGTYTLADKVLTFTDAGGNNQIISDNIDLAFTEFATTSGKTTEIKIDFTEPFSETLYVNCRLTPPITWAKTFGGSNYDEAYSVQQTSDGGYIIAGTSYSFSAGKDDIYLIKTNKYGDPKWSKTFGGSGNDRAYSVQQTSDGGYIIAGGTTSFGAVGFDVYLIKTNAAGEHLWSKTFGGSGSDYAKSIQQTTDGDYIMAGWTISFGSVNWNVYLIKTNDGGEYLWSKTFGTNNTEFAESVQQTTDGGYIIAGGISPSFSSEGGYDCIWRKFYLIKTNEDGEGPWIKTLGDNWHNNAYSVQQTLDGGYIIAGITRPRATKDCPTYFDVYLIKTDEYGVPQWSKTFGGSDYDEAYSVQQTSDGGYIIAGRTNSFGRGYDVYLIKTDEYGEHLWAKTFGGSNYDEAYSVQQTSDGGYIIAGRTSSFGRGYDVYLIKTDVNGNCPQASSPTVVPDTPTAEPDVPVHDPGVPS